ncbi:MAG TPA: M48 family metalloprotease [Fimbriimonadaceae bacterium]
MFRYAFIYLIFFSSAACSYYGCAGPIYLAQADLASILPLLILWILFFPAMVWLLYGGAVVYGKNEAIPVEKRCRLYLLAVTFTIPLAAAAHLIFASFMASSGTLKAFASAFADPYGVLWISFLPFIGIAFLGRIIKVALAAEGKLFAPDLPPVSLKLDGGEKRYNQSNARLRMAATLFLAGWVIYFVPPIFQDQPVAKESVALAGTALLLGVWLFGFKDRKSLRRFGLGEPSEDLTSRAKTLADVIGTKAKPVMVKEGLFADKMVMGRATRRAISVTLASVDQLTHDQMEFLLAHEIAHYRQNYFNKVLVASICFTVPAIAAAIYYWGTDFAREHPATAFTPIFFMVLGYMLYAKVLRTWARKREFEADKIAAIATRSPLAGVECLSICRSTSLRPYLHDYNTAMHPPLQKRLDALRAMAISH